MAVKKRKKAAPKSFLKITVGKARASDVIVNLKIGNTLAKKLEGLAGANQVLKMTEEQFYQALVGYGIQLESAQVVAEALTPPVDILDTARDIIYGDRERAYGSPRFNLDTIAKFWTVYLHRLFHSWGIEGAHLEAEDVAQMMILLKTSRLIHNPGHTDSLVDQAGYAALQERIQGL